ncbi:MAG: nucleotidyltransferase domain-containing protein [Nanoarchaeota archaeon]
MQALNSQQIQKLRNILKNKIKKSIIDIFIIGSALKNKLRPNDLDILVLFREENLKEVGERLFEIKENIAEKNIHIEPIFVDNLFEEKITLTVFHEGFSIKKNKFISELIKLNSFSIFSFNLANLSKIEKVRFAQALYGRKKDGLIHAEEGIVLGQGSFMINVQKEEIFKEFMKKWNVKYLKKRAFVSD